MRLFIAIEFPEPIKDALAESAMTLQQACTGGSFSLRENYHLTLVFLGEVDACRISEITAVMDRCVSPSFPISIGQLGCFAQTRGHVIWRAVDGAAALTRLQQKLSDELHSAGFSLEARAFLPHVTLAKRAVLKESCTLCALSAQLPELHTTAAHMTLMRSDQPGGKLTYTPIYVRHFLQSS